MCQSDPIYLCARFNPRVTQRNTQPARREHVENVLTRTTRLRTGLNAFCALYPQRHSTTRKNNASL